MNWKCSRFDMFKMTYLSDFMSRVYRVVKILKDA